VIAKETARALGLGANIQEAGGLPCMEADGKIPKDLGKKYGAMIIAADGFAQVSLCQLNLQYLFVECSHCAQHGCGSVA
jgi:H+-transporting ATPase